MTSTPVLLDPESLADCVALRDALYDQTGVELDPAAIRDALRDLVSGAA